MNSRIRRLFNQYCDCHFTLQIAGFPLFDGEGKKVGHVDRISVGRKNVRVEGWCTADKVALSPPAKISWERPNLVRKDVDSALKLKADSKTGFNIVTNGTTQSLLFSLKMDAMTVQMRLPTADRWALSKANLHLKLSFARRMLAAFPTLLRAYRYPNTVNKSYAKRALGMSEDGTSHVLDHQIFLRSKPPRLMEKITLIMPVFNAFEVLVEALERIEKHTDLPWRMILVEDCSTDPRVKPFLREWSHRQRISGRQIFILENAENLGFIHSVNRAVREALKYSEHIILINSDALVPKDWAHRLLHPILQNPTIASVTPFSNDAEICNIPTACKRTDLFAGESDVIDNILGQNLSYDESVNAPTGVGFCIAINRHFLSKVPQFDTAFGKGYGEEVDWCCRVSKLGGKHVVQPNLFVEHRGGSSFGSSAKQVAIARNNLIIAQRYPNYDHSVQQFIRDDPIKSARIFGALAMLTARLGCVDVFIAHSLGGGAELYLKSKIAQANQIDKGVVVLRLGGVSRWRIEIYFLNEAICGDTNSNELVSKYLNALPYAHIIYSCAVGDRDPSSLPKIISKWVLPKSRKFTFLVHDYFAISPSYCLLDSDGAYNWEQRGTKQDQVHTIVDLKGETVSAAQWRRNWFELLQTADLIECFSHSSANILRTAFSDLKNPISVKPHCIVKTAPIRRLTPTASPSLGVLGDIGHQKGARCIQLLSRELPSETFLNLTVVGRVDPNFTLEGTVVETGQYNRTEISALAEQHQIVAWLIPSIWPETYSYTIHEALATKLPVFCFDLGAQQEAAQSAENGFVLPRHWAQKPELILQQISKVLDNDEICRSFHPKTKNPRNRSVTARAKSTNQIAYRNPVRSALQLKMD